jgi:hypothetical protein
MKMRLTHNYEGGQSLSAVAHEIGFIVSAVNTVGKDAVHTKDHVNLNTLFFILGICI